SWLLVGVFGLLVGVVWLLGLTATITVPLLVATIVATVAMPVAGAFARHMPRAAAAALVLVGVVAICVFVVVIVIGGITSQRGQIADRGSAAADKAEHWLERAGVDESGASSAASSIKADIPKIISTLTKGLIGGIRGLASVAFELSLGALSLFFLLKDGPVL